MAFHNSQHRRHTVISYVNVDVYNQSLGCFSMNIVLKMPIIELILQNKSFIHFSIQSQDALVIVKDT